MKTRQLLATAAAVGALPFLAVAQVANEAKSPTSSGDGGVQTTKPQATTTGKGSDATTPRTDPPKLSPTHTQRGGAMDTGTPRDDADKNPNVEKADKPASKSTTKETE